MIDNITKQVFQCLINAGVKTVSLSSDHNDIYVETLNKTLQDALLGLIVNAEWLIQPQDTCIQREYPLALVDVIDSSIEKCVLYRTYNVLIVLGSECDKLPPYIANTMLLPIVSSTICCLSNTGVGANFTVSQDPETIDNLALDPIDLGKIELEFLELAVLNSYAVSFEIPINLPLNTVCNG